jgi:Flp pilus assembly pilin Flp
VEDETERNRLEHFSRHQCGATMVEYALLLSLIASLCAAFVSVLGQGVAGIFANLASAF